MSQSIITVLGPVITRVIQRAIKDQELRTKVEQEVTLDLLTHQLAITNAVKKHLTLDGNIQEILSSSWRPLTMFVFVFLVVARWFGYTAPGLSEAEYLQLWSIVELGLGGYVVGRTAEKTIPMITEILKRKN